MNITKLTLVLSLGIIFAAADARFDARQEALSKSDLVSVTAALPADGNPEPPDPRAHPHLRHLAKGGTARACIKGFDDELGVDLWCEVLYEEALFVNGNNPPPEESFKQSWCILWTDPFIMVHHNYNGKSRRLVKSNVIEDYDFPVCQNKFQDCMNDPYGCLCPLSPDADDDGTPDCIDGCPDDPNKTEPGVCGCGEPDHGPTTTYFRDQDSDGFGNPDDSIVSVCLQPGYVTNDDDCDDSDASIKDCKCSDARVMAESVCNVYGSYLNPCGNLFHMFGSGLDACQTCCEFKCGEQGESFDFVMVEKDGTIHGDYCQCLRANPSWGDPYLSCQRRHETKIMPNYLSAAGISGCSELGYQGTCYATKPKDSVLPVSTTEDVDWAENCLERCSTKHGEALEFIHFSDDDWLRKRTCKCFTERAAADKFDCDEENGKWCPSCNQIIYPNIQSCADFTCPNDFDNDLRPDCSDECPLDPSKVSTSYCGRDNDGDGYGRSGSWSNKLGESCNCAEDFPGSADLGGDCNDIDANVAPGRPFCMRDEDGDGFGDPNQTNQYDCLSACPSGYVLQGGDCNDKDSSIEPGVGYCPEIPECLCDEPTGDYPGNSEGKSATCQTVDCNPATRMCSYRNLPLGTECTTHADEVGACDSRGRCLDQIPLVVVPDTEGHCIWNDVQDEMLCCECMNESVSAYMYSYFHSYNNIKSKCQQCGGVYANASGSSTLKLTDIMRQPYQSFTFTVTDSSCQATLFKDPSGYFDSKHFSGSSAPGCFAINQYFANKLAALELE